MTNNMDYSDDLSINNERNTLLQQIKTESAKVLNLLTLISGELDEMNKMTRENGRLNIAVNEGMNSIQNLAKVGGVSLEEEDIKNLIPNGDTIPNITVANSMIDQTFAN